MQKVFSSWKNVTKSFLLQWVEGDYVKKYGFRDLRPFSLGFQLFPSRDFFICRTHKFGWYSSYWQHYCYWQNCNWQRCRCCYCCYYCCCVGLNWCCWPRWRQQLWLTAENWWKSFHLKSHLRHCNQGEEVRTYTIQFSHSFSFLEKKDSIQHRTFWGTDFSYLSGTKNSVLGPLELFLLLKDPLKSGWWWFFLLLRFLLSCFFKRK